MTTDIKELKRLAKAAEFGCLSHGNKRGFAELDAFHVAAHPSAVLDLIAHIEQLEGQLSAQTAEPAGYIGIAPNGDRFAFLCGEDDTHISHMRDVGYKIVPFHTHLPVIQTEQPSLSDEQAWDIYLKAQESVPFEYSSGKEFAIAWTKAILAQRQDSDTAILANIRAAMNGYFYALDTRQHGGIAQTRAFDEIQRALDMHWIPGAAIANGAPK